MAHIDAIDNSADRNEIASNQIGWTRIYSLTRRVDGNHNYRRYIVTLVGGHKFGYFLGEPPPLPPPFSGSSVYLYLLTIVCHTLRVNVSILTARTINTRKLSLYIRAYV